MNRLQEKFFLTLLFVFCFLGCATTPEESKVTQSYPETEKATEKLDFPKLIEFYKNSLNTDPNNAELNYNLSSAYLNVRDFKNAHDYIENAIRFAREKRDKEKYKVFYKSIAKDAYNNSLQKNNVAEYEMFLELFKFEEPYYDEVRFKLEELMYQEAIKQNAKEQYDKFRKSFPNSIHMQSVNDHLDQLAFEEVQKINTIKAYQDFITNNPFSSFKEAALERIDRLRFENAKMVDTIEAYSGFIQKYPANKYAGEAKGRIDALKFAKVEEKNEYDEYVKDNPEGVFVGISLDKIDEIRYQKAKSYDTQEALEDFIKKYPDSKFLDKAVKRLDVFRYEDAEKLDTIKGYETFLRKYPDSKFKYDAIERLEELKKTDKVSYLCEKGDMELEKGNDKRAFELYKEALSYDYSSSAHLGLGSIYEKEAEKESDYNKKIEYFYLANTEYMVILRKDPEFADISGVIDNLMEKKSVEQQIMNDARMRKQYLAYPFSGRLVTYSKDPVIVFSNASVNKTVTIDMESPDGKATKLEVPPQSEQKKTFEPCKIVISIKGGEMKKKYSIDLHPYYEYSLRVK